MVPGEISGYVIETSEKSAYKTTNNFIEAVQSQLTIDTSELESDLIIRIISLQNDKLEMQVYVVRPK